KNQHFSTLSKLGPAAFIYLANNAIVTFQSHSDMPDLAAKSLVSLHQRESPPHFPYSHDRPPLLKCLTQRPTLDRSDHRLKTYSIDAVDWFFSSGAFCMIYAHMRAPTRTAMYCLPLTE